MSDVSEIPRNLFDRLLQARERVSELVSRRKEKQEATRFEERAQQLSGPARSVREAASHSLVLANSGVRLHGINVEVLGRWRARLQGLLTAFQQNSVSILEPAPGENARIVLFDPLRKDVAEVNDALLRSWHIWVDAQVPAVPIELLQVLSGVPALVDSVSAIREVQRRVRQASEALPSDANGVEAILADAQRLTQMWASLSGGGIPEEVIAFLKAAGQPSGATFELLTREVSGWLKQNALEDTLRIRLS